MLPLDPTETVKVDRGTHHSGESALKEPLGYSTCRIQDTDSLNGQQ